MTKKVHFKFYIFGEKQKYHCGYEMFVDNIIATSDDSGYFSTPKFALWMAQQKAVDFVDMLNKIGTVPVEYSYSMGRIFNND